MEYGDGSLANSFCSSLNGQSHLGFMLHASWEFNVRFVSTDKEAYESVNI